MIKQGTRSVGNTSKSERPTHYAKGGKYGNMMAKPCPCIMNKAIKVVSNGKKTSRQA